MIELNDREIYREITKERCISPEKRQQIINDIRLI